MREILQVTNRQLMTVPEVAQAREDRRQNQPPPGSHRFIAPPEPVQGRQGVRRSVTTDRSVHFLTDRLLQSGDPAAFRTAWYQGEALVPQSSRSRLTLDPAARIEVGSTSAVTKRQTTGRQRVSLPAFAPAARARRARSRKRLA